MMKYIGKLNSINVLMMRKLFHITIIVKNYFRLIQAVGSFTKKVS